MEEFDLLGQRLDKMVNGAPSSPVFTRILKLLFSEEEARIARKIPGRPSRLGYLSKVVDVPERELDLRLTDMASRGLVVDFELEGVRYFTLPPVVIGFFEYTFMRTGDDLPMVEIAGLFDEYMDERFARSVFGGSTMPGRALVHERALDDAHEILDWERASGVLGSARRIGVSTCACRHKTLLLGKSCCAPSEVCLSLNLGADFLIKSGIAREISLAEALDIVHVCEDAGLVHTADNVKRHVTYICNCCSCCCGMMSAIRTYNIRNAIVSSGFVADIDPDICTGCGLCGDACPVHAIYVEAGSGVAVIDEELCLGCGVCVRTCRNDAIRMNSRTRRVFTPETVFDKTVAMAIERGKLADLLVEGKESLTFDAIGRIVGVIENSAPFKAAMAIEPLKSVFLDAVVRGARMTYGEIGRALE